MMTIMVIGIHQLTGEMSGSVVKKNRANMFETVFPGVCYVHCVPKKTSNFRKVVRQYTSVVEVLFFCWKFTSFSSSERILKSVKN